MMRMRIRFTKLGKVRFTSHRDLARVFERSMRKAQIAVAVSDGFTPRPKIAFGLALPVGAESLGEYLDVELVDRHEPAEFCALVNRGLPPGFDVVAAEEVTKADMSLQEDVVACSWLIELAGVSADAARAEIERVLATETLPMERSRKGESRMDDVRPAIEMLTVTAEQPVTLAATLLTRTRGLRLNELLMVCFPDLDPIDVAGRVLRTNQWIERDGARRDIIPLPDAVVPTSTPQAVAV
jgi:radical SAM-linked protein